MKKRTQKTRFELMQAGEEMFWEEMEILSGNAGKRYLVIDRSSGEIVAENLRLKKVRKVEV